MILTKEILAQGFSSRGGLNGNQTELLLEFRFNHKNCKKGWLKSLIGKDYPKETIDKFLALKDSHFKENVIKDANQMRLL